MYACDAVSVYRHSRTANYVVFNSLTGLTQDVDPAGKQATAVWCPFSAHVAYVRDHNIYMLEIATGIRTTCTTAGRTDGVVRFGDADWVYEEEILAGNSAMYFSPETMALAFLQFDDTGVPDCERKAKNIMP